LAVFHDIAGFGWPDITSILEFCAGRPLAGGLQYGAAKPAK